MKAEEWDDQAVYGHGAHHHLVAIPVRTPLLIPSKEVIERQIKKLQDEGIWPPPAEGGS